RRTLASSLLAGALATDVVVSPSFSLLQSGVGDQPLVCTSEIGNTVLAGSTMQPDEVPGSVQLPWTQSGLELPVDSNTISPGGNPAPTAVGGLKLRREPKSVYVQSSVQSLAFVKVIVTDTGIVGCKGP